MSLTALLTALAGPLAVRVLAALGIGWVTYEGLGLAAQAAIDQLTTQWGQLPASAAQIASLMGLSQSLGIILGAVVARLSISSFTRLGKL